MSRCTLTHFMSKTSRQLWSRLCGRCLALKTWQYLSTTSIGCGRQVGYYQVFNAKQRPQSLDHSCLDVLDMRWVKVHLDIPLISFNRCKQSYGLPVIRAAWPAMIEHVQHKTLRLRILFENCKYNNFNNKMAWLHNYCGLRITANLSLKDLKYFLSSYTLV